MTSGRPKPGRWSGGRLPVDRWPLSDATSWQRALDDDDPDDRRAAGHLSPASHSKMRSMYGQFLSWMQLTGRLDLTRSGTDQLTPDLLGLYLTAWRASSSDVTVLNGLGSLRGILNRLAPDRDWRWICRHRLAPRPRHARAARKAPQIFDVGLLLHRLTSELERLDALHWTPRLATRRRDCLIVAVAIYTALRRRNLHDLALGSSFIRRSLWTVQYEPGHSKTGAPILMQIPPNLLPHMDKYIEVDRPRLLGPTRSCKAVWVSRDKRGPALRSDSIRDAFIRIGRQMIGRPLSPHQVRYAAATTLLTRDPRVGKLVSALLTHDDERSVPEFYDQSGDAAAQAIWRDVKSGIQRPKPLV